MRIVFSYIASLLIFSFIFMTGFLISTIALNSDLLAAIFLGPMAIVIFGLLSIATYSLSCSLVSRKNIKSKLAVNLITSIPFSLLFSGFFFATASWKHGLAILIATFCGAHLASITFHKMDKTFKVAIGK